MAYRAQTKKRTCCRKCVFVLPLAVKAHASAFHTPYPNCSGVCIQYGQSAHVVDGCTPDSNHNLQPWAIQTYIHTAFSDMLPVERCVRERVKRSDHGLVRGWHERSDHPDGHRAAMLEVARKGVTSQLDIMLPSYPAHDIDSDTGYRLEGVTALWQSHGQGGCVQLIYKEPVWKE